MRRIVAAVVLGCRVFVKKGSVSYLRPLHEHVHRAALTRFQIPIRTRLLFSITDEQTNRSVRAEDQLQ